MIAGANYLLFFKPPDSFEEITKIIYTFSSGGEVIRQYIYPDSEYIKVQEEYIAIALTQEDTLALQGRISIEGQYIYNDTSVVKTKPIDKYISQSTFTEVIEGNFPHIADKDVDILPVIDDSVVVVVGGTKDYNKLINKPVEITSNEVTEIINKIGGLV